MLESGRLQEQHKLILHGSAGHYIDIKTPLEIALSIRAEMVERKSVPGCVTGTAVNEASQL